MVGIRSFPFGMAYFQGYVLVSGSVVMPTVSLVNGNGGAKSNLKKHTSSLPVGPHKAIVQIF